MRGSSEQDAFRPTEAAQDFSGRVYDLFQSLDDETVTAEQQLSVVRQAEYVALESPAAHAAFMRLGELADASLVEISDN